MLYLTAPLRFGKIETDPDQNVIHTLVSVCLVSKLTHVVSMDNKKKESFLIALNVLFGEVGLPAKLYVDEEKGLLAVHRDMLVEINEVIMKQHNVAIEQVTAQQHSAHGLVERRMSFIGEQSQDTCNLSHALFACSHNSEVGQWLLQIIRRCLPGVTPKQVVLLDLNLDEHLRLPIMWLVARTLSDIFSCRMDKKACTLFNTRATLEASIMLLRKTRHRKAAETLHNLVNQP